MRIWRGIHTSRVDLQSTRALIEKAYRAKVAAS
jgi:hypothetical protein